MHPRGPAGDLELVELIGLPAASSARAAATLRLTAVMGVAMAVVVGAWCGAVLGPAAGLVGAVVLLVANLGSVAMSRSQDARARRLAAEHLARQHGRHVALTEVRGTRPEPWRRAIERALTAPRD